MQNLSALHDLSKFAKTTKRKSVRVCMWARVHACIKTGVRYFHRELASYFTLLTLMCRFLQVTPTRNTNTRRRAPPFPQLTLPLAMLTSAKSGIPTACSQSPHSPNQAPVGCRATLFSHQCVLLLCRVLLLDWSSESVECVHEFDS